MTQSLLPKVHIIVLHYTGSAHTRACLESLRKLDYPDYTVLLIDNGSPDDSGPEVARDFPEVTFEQLPENLGFSGGSNHGLVTCMNAGADWIWLLNSDTIIDPDALKILMQVAQKQPDAGVLGALPFASPDSDVLDAGIGEISFWQGRTVMRKSVPLNQDFIACPWITGNNFLIRVQALRQVGIFDDRFFLYFEDVDLCVRLRHAGWTCLLVPIAKIFHCGNASTGEEKSTWRSYYHTRNRLLFFCKHGNPLTVLPSLLFIGSHLLRHALVLPFRGQSGQRQLKAEVLGARDWVLGRLGKANCLDW